MPPPIGTPATPQLIVGVDIAAKTATATWMTANDTPVKPVTFDQSTAGFSLLQQRLLATGTAPQDIVLVMEATGSYWITLATWFHAAGFRISVINAAKVHSYAKSLPRRGKSDAQDAQVLVQFARAHSVPRWEPPPDDYHRLRQRLIARDALLDMRKQAKNQRHALQQWPVVETAVMEQFTTIIATLTDQIDTLEAEIATVLTESSWASSAALLQSIPGVGVLTTAWLLVSTLNFTLCTTVEAATNYAGLAPLPYESGTSVKGRTILGHEGNARLRTMLYLASFSAIRANPVIKAFYERLRAAGKPPKVARCAAARKLLHLAWGVVKTGKAFDPLYGQRAHV
jgi:transposase